MGQRLIPSVTQIRDLRIIIDESLSFTPHIEHLRNQGTRKTYHLIKSLPKLSEELMTKLFCIYVRPSMEYGSEIFNPSGVNLSKLLEHPQKVFTRRLLYRPGAPRIPYADRIRHLSLDSLEFRRARTDLLMTYKILTGQIDLNRLNFFQFPHRVNERKHHQFTLQVPQIKKERNFFPYRLIPTWNNLPKNEMNTILGLEQFRSFLDNAPKNLILPNSVFSY